MVLIYYRSVANIYSLVSTLEVETSDSILWHRRVEFISCCLKMKSFLWFQINQQVFPRRVSNWLPHGRACHYSNSLWSNLQHIECDYKRNSNHLQLTVAEEQTCNACLINSSSCMHKGQVVLSLRYHDAAPYLWETPPLIVNERKTLRSVKFSC